ALANAYAQTMGAVFTTEAKPLETEIVVAQVGTTQHEDQIYRLSYDGSVTDEPGSVVMGGAAEELTGRVREAWAPGMTLPQVLTLARDVLSGDDQRELDVANLEAAVLDRTRPRRTFRRLHRPDLTELLRGEPE